MVTAPERALSYVSGLSFEDFIDDPRTQDAVAMSLIVLAEAAKGVPETIRASGSGIPWREIEGFRNRAAHSAMSVDLSLDLAMVWQICVRDLGVLLPELKTLLDLDRGA